MLCRRLGKNCSLFGLWGGGGDGNEGSLSAAGTSRDGEMVRWLKAAVIEEQLSTFNPSREQRIRSNYE